MPARTNDLATPDVTPAAIIAIVLAVITNAVVLLGLDLSDDKKAAISGLVTAVVTAAWLINDAIIRKGRAMGTTKRNTGTGVEVDTG